MATNEERFDTTRKFEGVKYKRWPDNPNSPIEQSMAECTCGRLWNKHEFAHGYCPLGPLKPGELR
jgi:hypothetical protein